VPPGHGELEFQYAALDFSAPEKTRFEYRLDSVDAGWIDAGGRRVAYYNNLSPGTYRFHVRSSNLGGGWNDAGASLSVILRPHYWQTVWFRGLLAFGIVGGAAGVGLYATRKRMQRKLVRLEQQQAVEKERGRIAKDMHDQIGAGLTQIGLLGEFARRGAVKNGDVKTYVERICDTARELARTLDEIVWMVNPKNDTLNKLVIYLAAYAEEFFQATDIRCRLGVPPNLPANPIPTEMRHNLFLTVQEALNNIAKHSEASEAKLEFILNDSTLEINVEDDGAGFVVSEANASRYGVSNMRERIKAIGGDIEILSQPRKGTRICLRIPLKGMVPSI
jgi:signal transduction histidine kinase